MRFEKFTTKLQEGLAEAQSTALGKDQQYIEPEHLLLALLNQEDGGIAGLVSKAGGNPNVLKKGLAEAIARLPVVEGEPGEVRMGRDLANLLNVADKEAQKRGDQYIASELFLLAAAADKGNVGRLLKQAGVTRAALEKAIEEVRGGETVQGQADESQRQALEKYTLDLTERARQGKLDPVIGRDDEIRRCIQILQRRTKNNPVLIGEPGVGTTTLDEYRKNLEKDAALERRFQKVLVEEPSVEATIAILRGLQERYEVHHGVEITDPAIVAAAELSHRYITDRFLPDKAIDLI